MSFIYLDHKLALDTLIQYGADVDIENKDGDTALHVAVENGNLPLVN